MGEWEKGDSDGDDDGGATGKTRGKDSGGLVAWWLWWLVRRVVSVISRD